MLLHFMVLLSNLPSSQGLHEFPNLNDLIWDKIYVYANE